MQENDSIARFRSLNIISTVYYENTHYLLIIGTKIIKWYLPVIQKTVLKWNMVFIYPVL